MDKVPFSELERRIQEARVSIAPGSRWEHYKGGKYIVTEIVIIEATSELGVIYRSLEHPTISFIRPLIVWQDIMEYEGQQKYRFRQIG